MDERFAWVPMAWDRIGGWPGLLTFVVLYALAATMFVHLLKFSDWLSRRRQEKRERKAQQRVIAQAERVAAAAWRDGESEARV